MFRFLCILPRCFPQKNRKDCHLSATFVEKYRCAKTSENLRCKAENDNKKRRRTAAITAFARRKRCKAAGENRKWTIPPGPPLAPMRYEKRLHMLGGSGCSMMEVGRDPTNAAHCLQ